MTISSTLKGITTLEEASYFLENCNIGELTLPDGLVNLKPVNYNFIAGDKICGVTALPIVDSVLGNNLFQMKLLVETPVPGFYCVLDTTEVVLVPDLVNQDQPTWPSVVELSNYKEIMDCFPIMEDISSSTPDSKVVSLFKGKH